MEEQNRAATRVVTDTELFADRSKPRPLEMRRSNQSQLLP